MYRQAIQILHDRGIAVMAGFIAGFDGDTPDSIRAMAQHLQDVGVDVPFLSILTPYKGTPLFDRLEADGRLLEDRGWQFYNGYNVAFQPSQMGPTDLFGAHRSLWRRAFSLRAVFGRVWRGAFQLHLGAFLLSLAMNGFYGLKAVRGNLPLDAATRPVAVQVGPTRPTYPVEIPVQASSIEVER
jgi:radical SAM superfamily enzyme YgiQ (UPF0313 family)